MAIWEIFPQHWALFSSWKILCIDWNQIFQVQKKIKIHYLSVLGGYLILMITISSRYLKKNQKKRIVSSDYFKSTNELLCCMKEPEVLWAVIWLFSPQKKKRKRTNHDQNWVNFCFYFKELRLWNPKNRPDHRGSVPVLNNCSTLLCY